MRHTRTDDAGLKLLTSPPVFDSLYTFCSARDLVHISRTCNGASQAVSNYLTHTLTVDLCRMLARFFDTQSAVLEFRRLQAKYQFLISGSAALQLLDRTVYPKSDLDLYLFPNDAQVIGNWLIEHGYTYSPYQRNGPSRQTFEEALASMPRPMAQLSAAQQRIRNLYGLPGVRDVLNFKKPLYMGKGKGKARAMEEGQDGTPMLDDDPVIEVQLIVSDITPYEAILKFHSTVVMNIVTWDRAIALYPLGTLEQRRTMVTHSTSDGYWKAIRKYTDRGFTLYADLSRFNDDFTRGAFRFGPRFFGDSQSWVVPLDTTGIDAPKEPVAVEGNSWEIYWNDRKASFAVQVATTPAGLFHHNYCICDDFLIFLKDMYSGGLDTEWFKGLPTVTSGEDMDIDTGHAPDLDVPTRLYHDVDVLDLLKMLFFDRRREHEAMKTDTTKTAVTFQKPDYMSGIDEINHLGPL
ncbi:hypothetical protein EXIGLDRAFT_687457 [Exidia glandulosa HHB12029]|uniref:Uncharacterized protein n=1 Tax=Exidia glandulosa HHB12029 TaxID=1314781 RepID=A0A165Z8P9_EXIGL|nr:hypothetical protein EXIGLDRAFT_687457 [Exidia glandulosa HHB12029]